VCRYTNGVHDYVRNPEKQDHDLVKWPTFVLYPHYISLDMRIS